MRVKRDPIQRKTPVLAITKADIFVPDIAGDGACRSTRQPAGLNRFIHDLEYALASSAPGLEQLIELIQLSNRFVKVAGQQQKSAEIAQLHRAIQNSSC